MFEEILGIPAHPLIVHAAVVFVPLQVLAAVGYAVAPFVRRYTAWLVVALAVLAPLAAFLAKVSGDAFRQRIISRGRASGDLLASIDQHSSYARTTLVASVALSALMVLLVVVHVARSRRPRNPDREKAETSKPGKGSMALALLLTLGVLALGGATGYLIFKTGDSGAKMAWDQM